MALVALLFAGVMAVTISVLPDPSAPERSVALAAEAMFGPLAGQAATVGVFVVVMGAMTGGFILTPRLLGQGVEQPRLGGRERHGLAADHRLAPVELERQVRP